MLPALETIARDLHALEASEQAHSAIAAARHHVRKIAALTDGATGEAVLAHVHHCEAIAFIQLGWLYTLVPAPVQVLLEQAAGILEGLETLPKHLLPRGFVPNHGRYAAESDRLHADAVPPSLLVCPREDTHDADGYPILPAYIKPRNQLAVWCVHCSKWHHHGEGNGHRVCHCLAVDSPYHSGGYILHARGHWTEAIRRAHGRERGPARCRECFKALSRTTGRTYCLVCRPERPASGTPEPTQVQYAGAAL